MLDYELVKRLVSAMSVLHEEHDHHGPHVAELARPLAVAAGLPAAQVELIDVGAHLHDIGKIMIDKDLLNLRRKLEPEEMDKMRLHTTLGWAIVEQAAFEPEICDIVRHHHECYGGNGYPDGLQFQQIPIGARIVAICDVYAALISPRTYRQAFTPPFAKSYLQAGKGKAFDPRLVDLFCSQVIGTRNPPGKDE